MVAANMGEKNDSKLDTQSLDSVAVPTNYSVTSEPPPYKWNGGKSVKIARLIAITVIAVAAILGGAIVLAAYIQTKGSQCTAADTLVVSPVPTSASLAAAEVRDISAGETRNEVKAEPKKEETVAEIKKEKEAEKEKEDEEEDEKELEKLMRLPFDINELAKMFLDINRKDNTNCFVEKIDMDEPSGKKPTKTMELGGATVAIICESISSPKPVLPFPFGMPKPQSLIFQSPIRVPFNNQPLVFHPQMIRPIQRMSPEPIFGLRPPMNPFSLPREPIPARHLVPPVRRLDTEEPLPARTLIPPRPQPNPLPRGLPFPQRPLPQRPMQPEIRSQPASIPVSPLTVPGLRGNPDLIDQGDRFNGAQTNLPKPRGRSLNFDGPVIPFSEEKSKQALPASAPAPNNIMNFLRSILTPNRNDVPQPQQRSLTPAQAIPIPIPIQQSLNPEAGSRPNPEAGPRPVGRELRLQPVITLPQFLQVPPSSRSHTIQPRSVN